MKRNKWSYDETLEMLNIMLRQESLKAMNGRPFRKDKAFLLVCEEMVHRGYNTKDPKQIEHRWKNLKRLYTDLQKDPSLAETIQFPYYDEIDVLMRGTPSASTQQGSKLCELVICKVEPTQKPLQGEEVIVETEETEPIEKEECESVAIGGEEIVEDTVAEGPKPPPSSDAVPSRLKRNRKRQGDAAKTIPPPYKLASEEEVFQNQKRLIDYQFELYSRAQEQSDRKFLEMNRQLMESCNEKFQLFLSKLAPGN